MHARYGSLDSIDAAGHHLAFPDTIHGGSGSTTVVILRFEVGVLEEDSEASLVGRGRLHLNISLIVVFIAWRHDELDAVLHRMDTVEAQSFEGSDDVCCVSGCVWWFFFDGLPTDRGGAWRRDEEVVGGRRDREVFCFVYEVGMGTTVESQRGGDAAERMLVGGRVIEGWDIHFTFLVDQDHAIALDSSMACIICSPIGHDDPPKALQGSP